MDCRSRCRYSVQQLAASPLHPLISSSPPSEPCVPQICPSSAFRALVSGKSCLRCIVPHFLLFSCLSSSSLLRPLLLSRLRWRRFESYSSSRLSSRREDDW